MPEWICGSQAWLYHEFQPEFLESIEMDLNPWCLRRAGPAFFDRANSLDKEPRDCFHGDRVEQTFVSRSEPCPCTPKVSLAWVGFLPFPWPSHLRCCRMLSRLGPRCGQGMFKYG